MLTGQIQGTSKKTKKWTNHALSILICVGLCTLLCAVSALYLYGHVCSENALKNIMQSTKVTSFSASLVFENADFHAVGLNNEATVGEYLVAKFLNEPKNHASDDTLEVSGLGLEENDEMQEGKLEPGNDDAKLAETEDPSHDEKNIPISKQVTQAEVQEILKRTTIEEYLEEKICTMVTNLTSGKKVEGITAVEMKSVLEENEEVIMEYTGKPLSENAFNAVDAFFESNDGKWLSDPMSLGAKENESAGEWQRLMEWSSFARWLTSPWVWIILSVIVLGLIGQMVWIHQNRWVGLIYGSFSILLVGVCMVITGYCLPAWLDFTGIEQGKEAGIWESFMTAFQQASQNMGYIEIAVGVICMVTSILLAAHKMKKKRIVLGQI
ncbi:MAG TPA: hypothetical protein DCY75_02685 [Clostridiales bacterium]|nr:hypothetical protein [Clostridiales bacterium]